MRDGETRPALPRPMEIVWQSAGAPARKRTSQACQTCRSRKKRCYHDEKEESPPERVSPDKLPPPTLAVAAQSETRESSPSPSRVSIYNPESVLEDLSEGPKSGAASGTPKDVPPVSRDVAAGTVTQALSTAHSVRRQLAWFNRQRRRPATPKLSQPHRRYLEDVGAFLELPRTTTDGLLPIYIMFLDDLIPIMNGTKVFHEYSNGHSSIHLVKAMCLVACKTKPAAPFLRLSNGGPLLSPLKFASSLLAGLDAAIKSDLEADRVVKIQILALMHLYNDGIGGVERSSGFLLQAIGEAWAMSLHFSIPGNDDQYQCDLLWWCLRNFDRLNKPIMAAAPFLIDDSDIGLKRIEPTKEDYRSRIMSVSLKLGDLMVRATKVYKGSFTGAVDDCDEFPTLDQTTANTSFEHFHRSHRAYLEIWYHLAAMLSCRYSGPRTALYNRRLSSADRILAIITREGHENLPPLPLIPYALSVSTTIAYRAFRDGERDTATSCDTLQRCCDILEALSHHWTTAKGVAKLARRSYLAILDKTSATRRNNDEKSQRQQAAPHATTQPAPANKEATTLVDSSTRQQVPEHYMPSNMAQPSMQPTLNGPALAPFDNFPRQFSGSWPDTNVSYLKLDTAFDDMFDYGMVNVFQDPFTWELMSTDVEPDMSPEMDDNGPEGNYS